MSAKNYKIAIIGNPDAIGGFRAVGVDAIGINSAADAQNKIQELYDQNDYAVVFITEDWAEKIKSFLKQLPAKALPSIVAIPSQAGSTGAGLEQLSAIVEQAVGSDILSN